MNLDYWKLNKGVHMSLKGDFNVFKVADNLWELRFMRSVVIWRCDNRSWLYRLRKKYSSWFFIITTLQRKYLEDIRGE